MAHTTDAERAAYLAALAPGADIDHSGTPFTQGLLSELVSALQDPITNISRIGDARFVEAQFTGDARFDGAQFTGDARFDGAQFTDVAWFSGAQFGGDAWFGEAQFSSAAWFGEAQFTGAAMFDGAQFSREVRFRSTQFSGDAWFRSTQFSGDAWFGEAQFTGDAWFSRAQFSSTVAFDRAQFGGHAGFPEAQFGDGAWFTGVRFTGHAEITGAQFRGDAGFGGAQFRGGAWLTGVQFTGDAWFSGAQFTGDAEFDGAQFSSAARFDGAQFSSAARFDGAQFTGDADFSGVQFSDAARFVGARFAGASALGPLVCWDVVSLSGAVFEAPVTVQVAAGRLVCVRTRWESTATLRTRYARVDLTDAVLSAPVALTTHPVPFTFDAGETANEFLLAGGAGEERVKVVSVQGVDAAHLVLTDTDLSECLFTNAFHLDQIRLDGRTTFAPVPEGIHWRRGHIWPTRWSNRRSLAEEHHWRAQAAGQPVPPSGQLPSASHWRPGPHHPDLDRTPDPEGVAAVYRQLRKAFEDGKNEPGAADFYYGEMEMRRHDRAGTPGAERGLLHGYWLLSGYGLRSSRAVAWLLAAMSLTVLLLMGFGLPTRDPDPASHGTLTHGEITLATSTPDPALSGGWNQRMTWTRAEKATRIAVNSVVFRSSGQNLTTAGTYIEMASRLFEPTLLALAVLAVRGRIKR